VADKMRELPIKDITLPEATIREDGRVLRPMYLFQTKPTAESKGPWDVYKVVSTIASQDAWRPLSEGNCPLIQAK
jgi:branched-chain amino acid transport system substrate-binding protein